MLIFIIAPNEELRKSSQWRDRRFLLSGKGFSLFCSHGRSAWCLGITHADAHGGIFPLLNQRCTYTPGVPESDGGQQWPKLPRCKPKDTQP